MSDQALRSSLIRLAAANPALRKEILPLLMVASEEETAKFEEGKPVDPTENMSPEDAAEWKKHNVIHRDDFKKKAHGPVALSHPDVMLYMIDRRENHSKFYEMKVVSHGTESSAKKTGETRGDMSWVLMRRWGRLTDSGNTGRVDSINDFFGSQAEALMAMRTIRGQKTGKGYTDVSSTRRYPIGLGGAGFGWGGQAACAYVPELRGLKRSTDDMISQLYRMQGVLQELTRQQSNIAGTLGKRIQAVSISITGLSNFLDSEMAECR